MNDPAIVRAGLAPVRARPDVRAEQTSQELLGQAVERLEERDGWVRVRGADGYEGWVTSGALLPCSPEQVDDWLAGAGGRPAIALDAVIASGTEPICRLPWGARITVDGLTVRLPDGRTGELGAGAWVLVDELEDRFPPTAEGLAATARSWMGTPYVWGGRTRWGADCSGFAQAVYGIHGVRLPRDSGPQSGRGAAVDPGPDGSDLRPGDLLAFRAADSERIVHVAISLGGPRFIHAALDRGAVQEDGLDGASELERNLAARLVGARRLFE